MKQEDAIRKLVEWIRQGCSSRFPSYGYEVYVPNLIGVLFGDRNQQIENSPVFFDAAWELCRRGILRPGVKDVSAQGTDSGSGGGFCLTAFGKTWLSEPDHTFVPTEPERYAELIAPFRDRFGPGYFERSQQAIRCYGAHAYLACPSLPTCVRH